MYRCFAHADKKLTFVMQLRNSIWIILVEQHGFTHVLHYVIVDMYIGCDG